MKLPISYYQTHDVVYLAKDLLGKFLLSNINGHLTGGMIIETEAYAGIHDQASHAFGNRKTNRTKTMYQKGGISYIYFCYGIHHLFNIVTGELDVPHAVLIRSIIPVVGLKTIFKRTGKNHPIHKLSDGPGKLTKALGITLEQNSCPLNGNLIWIEDRKVKIDTNDIRVTKRIGVQYAGSDTELPYRFLLNKSKIHP